MREIAGYLLLTIWVLGLIAELALHVWEFAAVYHRDEKFRARADRFFTTRRPGLLGLLVHAGTVLGLGLNILLNAAVWPASWLFNWTDRRTRAVTQPAPAADTEA